MKITTVEIDGREFRIAPLNCLQVEEMADAPASSDTKENRARAWKIIVDSMENAGDCPGLPVLKKDLDLTGFRKLHDAVLEVSGLKLGETPAAAASASTSDGSAPA